MTWTLVQGIGTQTGGSTTPHVSFNAHVTPGSVVIGWFFYTSSGSTDEVSSVVDDLGNTYSIIEFHSANPTQVYNAILFWSAAALSNNPITVTANVSPSESNQWFVVGEFTPPAGALAVDAHLISYGTGNNPSVGPITAPNAGDLIFSAIAANAAASIGSGFSAVFGNASQNAAEYQVMSSAGTISGTWTGTLTDWIAGVAAFSGGAGGAGPLPAGIVGFVSNEW